MRFFLPCAAAAASSRRVSQLCCECKVLIVSKLGCGTWANLIWFWRTAFNSLFISLVASGWLSPWVGNTAIELALVWFPSRSTIRVEKLSLFCNPASVVTYWTAYLGLKGVGKYDENKLFRRVRVKYPRTFDAKRKVVWSGCQLENCIETLKAAAALDQLQLVCHEFGQLCSAGVQSPRL